MTTCSTEIRRLDTRKYGSASNFTLYAKLRPGTSDERVIKEVLEQRTYRKQSIGFDVEKGEEWLDLGANIGAFGLYCVVRGATAACWEPNGENYELLLENLKGYNGFSFHESAVSHYHEETLPLYAGRRPDDRYRYTLIKSSNPTGSSVRNTYAGSLFSGLSPQKDPPYWDGVKMDIEGSELGLIDNLLIPNCKKLVMEYHLTKDPSMVNFRRRMKTLRKHFETVSYIPSLDQEYPNDKYPGFYDRLIFCKK